MWSWHGREQSRTRRQDMRRSNDGPVQQLTGDQLIKRSLRGANRCNCYARPPERGRVRGKARQAFPAIPTYRCPSRGPSQGPSLAPGGAPTDCGHMGVRPAPPWLPTFLNSTPPSSPRNSSLLIYIPPQPNVYALVHTSQWPLPRNTLSCVWRTPSSVSLSSRARSIGVQRGNRVSFPRGRGR